MLVDAITALELITNTRSITAPRDQVTLACRTVADAVSSGDTRISAVGAVTGLAHICGHADAAARVAAGECLTRAIRYLCSRGVAEIVSAALCTALTTGIPGTLKSCSTLLSYAIRRVPRMKQRDAVVPVYTAILQLLSSDDATCLVFLSKWSLLM